MKDQDSEIQVAYYSGYKGRETPRAIRIGGHEYPVEKVLSRKRIQDKESGERAEIFRCRVAGRDITLKVDPSGECRILGPGLGPPPPLK